MQIGFTSRPAVLLHSHGRHCKFSLVLHFHSIMLAGKIFCHIIWQIFFASDDAFCKSKGLLLLFVFMWAHEKDAHQLKFDM